VLGLCLVYPQDAVEQQLGRVVRGKSFEFEARPVQHDLPQPADLRIDVEHGTPGSEKFDAPCYLIIGG
jgi:hypothetical protein